MYLVNAQGRTVFTTIEGAGSVSAADRAYFIALRDGARFYTSSLLVSRLNGQRVFLFTKRLQRGGDFAGALPPSFLLFGLVGGTGVVVHLTTLAGFTAIGQGFVPSQIMATLVAMAWNFVLNNNPTYADRKLRGARLITGFLSFCGICALGGIANISVANAIYQFDHQTLLAGLPGAIMSSVFNYAVTRAFTWKQGLVPLTQKPVERSTGFFVLDRQ